MTDHNECSAGSCDALIARLQARVDAHDKACFGSPMALGYYSGNDARLMRDAIDALRLVPDVAQPVAWTNEAQLGFLKSREYDGIPMAMWSQKGAMANIPIYASQPPVAPVDLTNHHNALKCPYCNPKGLKFAEPHEGCSAASEHAKVADWLDDQARIATNSLHCGDNSAMIQQTHDWAGRLEAAARHLRAVPQTVKDTNAERCLTCGRSDAEYKACDWSCVDPWHADAHLRAKSSAARWRVNGEPDPHGNQYDCERSRLAHGDMTDDEIANALFLKNYDIGIITAAKERIRWLSRALETALAAQPPAAPVDPVTATIRRAPELLDAVEAAHSRSSAGNGDALRKALKWALPLADLALEQCRQDRMKAGHNDITFKKPNGQTWVGLYQSEWDDREAANEALTLDEPQPTPEQVKDADFLAEYNSLAKANQAISLANKIDLHLTLSGASPGFHLSEDELQMAAAALRFAAISSLSRPHRGSAE